MNTIEEYYAAVQIKPEPAYITERNLKKAAIKAAIIAGMESGLISIGVDCSEIEPTFGNAARRAIIKAATPHCHLASMAEDALKSLSEDVEAICSVTSLYQGIHSGVDLFAIVRDSIDTMIWEEAISDTFRNRELQDIYKLHPEFEKLNEWDEIDNPPESYWSADNA